MKIMRAEYIRNKLHYFGKDYEFTLIMRSIIIMQH